MANCYQCGRKVSETTTKRIHGKTRIVCEDREDCHDNTDYDFESISEDTPYLDEPWWKNP